MIPQLVFFALLAINMKIRIYTCYSKLYLGKAFHVDNEYSENIHKNYFQNMHAYFGNFKDSRRMKPQNVQVFSHNHMMYLDVFAICLGYEMGGWRFDSSL